MSRAFLIISTIILSVSQNIFTQNTSSLSVFDLNKDRLIAISVWEYLAPDTNVIESPIIDSSWKNIGLNDLNLLTGNVITIRKKILLKGSVDESDVLALLLFNISSAYEIYWDGLLIGTNGKTGKHDEQEESGTVRLYVPLKYSYTSPGEHILQLRISNFSKIGNEFFSQIILGYSAAINWEENINTNKNILFLIFFFSMVLISLSLYISGWRNLSFLFFGLFTLVLSIKYVWLYLLDLDFIKISFAQWFHTFITYLTEDIAIFLLFLFVIWHFDISNKKKHIVPALILFILILFLTTNANVFSFWILRSLLSLYAIIIITLKLNEKYSGSISLLMAFGLFLIYSLYNLYFFIVGISYQYSFLVSVIVNVIIFSLFIIAISTKIQDQNRKFQAVLLRSQRLETELLKKSIQPHFIMNTLLSIKSRLLKDTSKAEKIIDALADQFRMINEISSKDKIPLEEEIKLCELHLEMMGYRFNAKYKFIINGDLCDKNVPPLIFHTLVENAFTHAYLPKEDGIFYFECMVNHDDTIYKLRNDGSQISELLNKSANEIEEGLGLKYIRTRLEEIYPGKWQLRYGVKNNLWDVLITIRN